ncbi:MAG: hypothetical protein RLZZ628_2903 [Bacteroidota bacterium]|jgi:hypothetical protein
MKKNILILICFLITASLRGQTLEQVIERLERQRFEAQVKKDTAFLEKIFADDLVYIHASGKKDDKTSYLQSIKNGKSVYDKIDVEAITVRMYGKDKVAVVNGVITIVNVNATPAHLRYLVVYSKNGKKGWQLNSWQSLKLAQ